MHLCRDASCSLVLSSIRGKADVFISVSDDNRNNSFHGKWIKMGNGEQIKKGIVERFLWL